MPSVTGVCDAKLPILWRVPRNVQVSWATPVLLRAGGRDELVTSGTEWIVAYVPSTGTELWRVKGLASNAVPSPGESHLYAIGARAGS